MILNNETLLSIEHARADRAEARVAELEQAVAVANELVVIGPCRSVRAHARDQCVRCATEMKLALALGNLAVRRVLGEGN